MAKSAIAKLNVDKQPHVVSPIPKGFPGWTLGPSATMVVSTPREVDAVMRQVRKGRLITLDELRAHLAQRHKTTIACPVSTGIFVNIAAAASEERLANGQTSVTAYWRTLRPKGELNPKFPGGVLRQKAKLEAEGHEVVMIRNKYFVKDFERKLAKLTP